MTKPQIKQTQFQSLLPLQEAKQVELLQKLVSKEITLKELKQTAAKEKRMGDLKEKFLHLTQGAGTVRNTRLYKRDTTC